MTGTIPATLVQLTSLQDVSIFGPLVTGTIPYGIGNLRNLSTLSFQGAPYLSGSIPPSLYQLRYLSTLNLDHSGISGTISSDIGNLKLLNYLSVSNSNIEGSLPTSIGELRMLQYLYFSDTDMKGPIPATIGNCSLLLELRAVDLRGGGLGQLPSSMGLLKNLMTLDLGNSGVSGTIPPEFKSLRSLYRFWLPKNEIEGTIPDLTGMGSLWRSNMLVQLQNNRLSGSMDGLAALTYSPSGTLMLYSNKLTGTIPTKLFDSCPSLLDLQDNLLSGTIPSRIFNNVITTILLQQNQFNGTIPTPTGTTERLSLQSVSFSSNRLTGSIPNFFLYIPQLAGLDLSNNPFNSSLENWSQLKENPPTARLDVLLISGCRLYGPIPDFSPISSSTIDLSNNLLSGTIPLFHPNVRQLNLADNKLDGDFSALSFPSNLQRLTLSGNLLSGTIPKSVFLQSIIFLSLDRNNLVGSLPQVESRTMATLDLSFNALSGTLPSSKYLGLNYLKLSHNRFTGDLKPWIGEFGQSSALPQVAFLDISNNAFSFPIDQFVAFSTVITLDASNNTLTGSLDAMSRLSSLKLLDLSNNHLSGLLPLNTISYQFSRDLQRLSIQGNPLLRSSDILKSIVGPKRTSLSQPSRNFPLFVDCFSLSFDLKRSYLLFTYDEKLFNYAQCDCSAGFYGIPPSNCYSCPSESECRGRNFTVKQDNYIYYAPRESTLHTFKYISSSENTQTEVTAQSLDSLIQTESCVRSVAKTESNCLRLEEQIQPNADSSSMQQQILIWQRSLCRQGSAGRLCSKCICDDPFGSDPLSKDFNSLDTSSSTGSCYFMRGSTCVQCETIFRPRYSILVALASVLAFFLGATLVMFLVLRSRRLPKDQNWTDMSILRRVWYRLTEGVSLGSISILVLFVQILVELTHWDDYILKTWAELFNANATGLGIVCLFPTVLSRPIMLLLLKLLLPVVVAGVIASSIASAELMYRLIDSCQNRAMPDENGLLCNSDAEESTFNMLNDSSPIFGPSRIEYPMAALLSSTTISVFKFFYFSVALASTEFFFSEKQPHTNVKYIQEYPWMLFADAEPMRRLSIPWIVLLVAGLPIAFIVSAWRFRHKILSPTTSAYFGSIFTRFKTRWYWWELVNVVKKLTIALLLRGVPSSNALQTTFIIVSIGLPLLLQTTFRPWKRRTENLVDPIGGILLILSLFASNTSKGFPGSEMSLRFVLVMDLIYVIGLAVLIVYETVTRKTDYETIWEARFDASRSKKDSMAVSNGQSFEPIMRSPINMTSSDNDQTEGSLDTGIPP
jgi:Leucine-rich repeat (LRR) protein